MRDVARNAWLELLAMQNSTLGGGGENSDCFYKVQKENLVVVDPDLMTDYPPLEQLIIAIPDWIKVRITIVFVPLIITFITFGLAVHFLCNVGGVCAQHTA